jgi:hypothetical protein
MSQCQGPAPYNLLLYDGIAQVFIKAVTLAADYIGADYHLSLAIFPGPLLDIFNQLSTDPHAPMVLIDDNPSHFGDQI